jgi:hypothetical protein
MRDFAAHVGRLAKRVENSKDFGSPLVISSITLFLTFAFFLLLYFFAWNF